MKNATVIPAFISGLVLALSLTYGDTARAALTTMTFLNSELQLTIADPVGIPTSYNLNGSSSIGVDLDNAVDDNGNGRDEVQSQLLTMFLSDAAGIDLRLAALPLSTGEMEELVNLIPGVFDVPPITLSGSGADSSFDVFLELDIAGNGFYNADPLFIQGLISSIPLAPDDMYVFFGTSVPLLTLNGENSGYAITEFIYTPGAPVPVPGAVWLFISGLLGLIGLGKRGIVNSV